MAVQALEGVELSRTEIAFIGIAIPGSFGGNGLDVVVSGKGDHWTRNDVVAVELVDHAVDFLAVEARGRAAARLKTVRTWKSENASKTVGGAASKCIMPEYVLDRHTGSCCESNLAPRALNRCPNMCSRMKVLN